MFKQTNQESVPQYKLVAAGKIVRGSPLMTLNPSPTEVMVEVTTVMNNNSNLKTGQVVVWAKKDMALFNSQPVFLHLEGGSDSKHNA